MRLTTSAILLFVSLLLSFSAPAQVESRSSDGAVVPDQYYLISPNDDWDLEKVQRAPADLWQHLGEHRASFGYTEKTYWFRFSLGASDDKRILHIAYPLLDDIRIYWQRADGLQQFHLGDTLPYQQRPLKVQDFAVVLEPSKYPSSVYLAVKTSSSMRVPIKVWTPQQFLNTELNSGIAEGLYFGVLLCMVVYNLFGFISSRESGFAIYSLYTICIGGLMLALEGMGYRYVWPNWQWLQAHGIPMFGSLALITGSLFALNLLQVREHSRFVARGLHGLIILAGIVLVLALFTPYSTSIKATLALAAPGCLYLLLVGVYVWRKGLVYARIFTLAWASLLIAVIANSLGYLGIIDSMFIQRHAIMLGSGIEILLLSWVLAVRYSEERREKMKAQSKALRQAVEMQQTQTKQNEQLEENVAERTFELQIALRELQEANNELERKSAEDSLTKLHNRRYFTQHLEKEFRRAQRNQTPLSLLMIDIDHFKPINDTHGHFVGDQILQQLAELLKGSVRRPSDSVCRYGGEEFAIILPETDAEGAESLAQQVVEAVRNAQFDTDEGPLSITVSIGIAEAVIGAGEHAENLFREADAALYRAKRDGRDQVVSSDAAQPLSKDEE